ncbi:hypothetical protein BFP70_03300 [Thioclava sp. SK-1]|nr:hypothetical protein BFP70_03300 [Thioclava sp. SK-1]
MRVKSNQAVVTSFASVAVITNRVVRYIGADAHAGGCGGRVRPYGRIMWGGSERALEMTCDSPHEWHGVLRFGSKFMPSEPICVVQPFEFQQIW